MPLNWKVRKEKLYSGLIKSTYISNIHAWLITKLLLFFHWPGAGEGVSYFITPEWDALLDFNIWSAAASQILFSLSIGFGSQLVLSSFNNFRTNTQRDSILISIFNSLTSVYAGFVVFAILGFLKVQTQKPIEKVSILEMGAAHCSLLELTRLHLSSLATPS